MATAWLVSSTALRAATAGGWDFRCGQHEQVGAACVLGPRGADEFARRDGSLETVKIGAACVVDGGTGFDWWRHLKTKERDLNEVLSTHQEYTNVEVHINSIGLY